MLHELVRAVELTYNFGAEQTAEIEYVDRQTVYNRIRKLERITCIRFFDGQYHRYSNLTKSGREWLNRYNSLYG